MSAEARIEWTGNIQVHQPSKDGHRMLTHQRGGIGTHICTACSWQVETYSQPGTEQYAAAKEKVTDAFDKHLTEHAGDEP